MPTPRLIPFFRSAAIGFALACLAATAPNVPPSETQSFADFHPSRHGFAFANSFTGSPLPFSLGTAEKSLGVPSHYGLCGGMAFAAADFFLAGRTMPTDPAPPAKGRPLYSYILQRQTDSLGTGLTLGARFGRWMALPDDTALGTQLLTCGELGPILDSLARGEPVILGLVLVSRKQKQELWTNHQVLACAAKPRERGGLAIRIYDPNFPHNDSAVIDARPAVVGSDCIFGVRIPVLGAACVRRAAERRDTPVRGLFVMPYSPKSPPAGL